MTTALMPSALMPSAPRLALVCLACSFGLTAVCTGDDVSINLDNVVDPGPNVPEEPVRGDFSLDQAARFLDSAALTWQKEHQCFTCHTNFAYLYARPSLSANVTAHQQVRAHAEAMVRERWPTEGPRWDAEVIATAAALAFNDAATSQKLHPTTRVALDRMWSLQKEDGGWDWLKCDWPPMESDDHYGVSVAAIAVGVAPEGYAKTPAAEQGVAGIRRYLQANPPPTLHHRAMLLWGASYLPELQTTQEVKQTVAHLLELQKQDGGWSLATLGNWQRADHSPQDTEHSDGYGTGFVIYVLRQAGLPASHASLQRGVEWLKSHQRQSGRWFTRSLHQDSMHYLTHAGTAMSVMALAACHDPVIGQPAITP